MVLIHCSAQDVIVFRAVMGTESEDEEKTKEREGEREGETGS